MHLMSMAALEKDVQDDDNGVVIFQKEKYLSRVDFCYWFLGY